MFFRKRRHREPQNMYWVKWLLVLFALYAVFIYPKHMPENTSKEIKDTITSTREEFSATKIADNLNEYKEKIFPSRAGALRIRDMVLGSGIPAVCGQEVRVAYSTYTQDGKLFADSATRDKPLTFIIGEKKVMPVFEHGTIGMQPSGERSIYAPPNYAYGVAGFTRSDAPQNELMRFDIALIDATPALPNPDESLYRIAVTRTGVGFLVVCGDHIKLHLTFWDMTGKKLFSTHDAGQSPAEFTLGQSDVMVGLEQGVIGMTSGEMRTLIIPPDFQKPLRKEKPTIEFPLPANQTVLVDVETVQ